MDGQAIGVTKDLNDYLSKLGTLPESRPESFIVLEGFFARSDRYTRRRALLSLAELGSTTTFEKAVSFFATRGADQWDRAACLTVLMTLPEHRSAFDQHLSEYDRMHWGDQDAMALVEKLRAQSPQISVK